MEWLESKQMAWRVHQNCLIRGVSQDHSKQPCLVEKCEEIAGIACCVVVLTDTDRNGMWVHPGHVVDGAHGFSRGNL